MKTTYHQNSDVSIRIRMEDLELIFNVLREGRKHFVPTNHDTGPVLDMMRAISSTTHCKVWTAA